MVGVLEFDQFWGILKRSRSTIYNLKTLEEGDLVKSNDDFTCKLLNQLDVCAISGHWLHDYDLHQLQNLHPDFNVFSTCSPPQEDE